MIKKEQGGGGGGGKTRRAAPWDVVTIDLNLQPEKDYVPYPLFDTVGEISLVLGWGNYLPGLHQLIEGMAVGDEVRNVSIDAGWGSRRKDLIVQVSKSTLKGISKSMDLIRVGTRLHLQGDIEVTVIDVTDETITVDANPPLAGASFSCNMKILDIASCPNLLQTSTSTSTVTRQSPDPDGRPPSPPSRYEVATFGLGCFWGAELAFMRAPGVVGTKVGYTQGVTVDPTYEQVCSGRTKHREAVMVMYDPRQISYRSLMDLAIERLSLTTTPYGVQLFDEDEDHQYRFGFYYHTDEQHQMAVELLGSSSESNHNNRFRIEVRPAAMFYDAEEYHQKYLVKGGQSARKGAKESIRCFG